MNFAQKRNCNNNDAACISGLHHHDFAWLLITLYMCVPPHSFIYHIFSPQHTTFSQCLSLICKNATFGSAQTAMKGNVTFHSEQRTVTRWNVNWLTGVRVAGWIWRGWIGGWVKEDRTSLIPLCVCMFFILYSFFTGRGFFPQLF